MYYLCTMKNKDKWIVVRVTNEVVFSRRDAYVNSLGKITAGFAGILYKIVGANRTIFTGATFTAKGKVYNHYESAEEAVNK